MLPTGSNCRAVAAAAAFCGLVFGVVPVCAQGPDLPPLGIEEYLARETVGSPVLSPDGHTLYLTRDIAAKFNHDFGVDFFPITEPVIEGVATRVMNLQDGTKKMSKSDPNPNNYIALLDDPDTVRRKIARAITDSGTTVAHDQSRPAITNLVEIFSAVTMICFAVVINGSK